MSAMLSMLLPTNNYADIISTGLKLCQSNYFFNRIIYDWINYATIVDCRTINSFKLLLDAHFPDLRFLFVWFYVCMYVLYVCMHWQATPLPIFRILILKLTEFSKQSHLTFSWIFQPSIKFSNIYWSIVNKCFFMVILEVDLCREILGSFCMVCCKDCMNA